MSADRATSAEARAEHDGFPFPITEGTEESKNVTWLRNHSNYMAVRGPFDYLKAVSVLVRGILVNFLIVLPYLLGASIAVAASRFLPPPPSPLPQPPFVVTKAMLVLFLAVVLAFAVLTPLLRILTFRRTRKTGSDSSVRQRGRLEGWYGAVLLGILGAAAFESTPLLLDALQADLSWPTLTSAGAVVAVIFSVAPKLLSGLGEGLTKKLALVAVGAIGLVVPLVVVLYVAHLLAFGPWVDWLIWAWIAAVTFPLAIVLAALLGTAVGAFKRGDAPGVVALVTGSLALVVLVTFTGRRVDQVYIVPAATLHRDAVVQLDPRTLEALVAHVSQEEGRRLRTLSHKLTELGAPDSLTWDPGSDSLPDPLSGLARAGWEAGLYPYLDEVVEALGARLDGCDAGRPADECEGLREEVRHLGRRAGSVRDAYRARSSPGDLTRTLVASYRAGLGSDTLGLAAYPRLAGALRVEGRCPTADDAGPPAICEVLRIQTAWERELLRAGGELGATAGISLRSMPFYQTAIAQSIRINAFWPKVFLVSILVLELGFFCWLTIDVNLTSMHGVYRDRLAAAFLVGKAPDDADGDEDDRKLEDLDLIEICRHEEGSTAPYHLINAALNLQGSKALGVRDRRSDFFIFSKRFIGGNRTGYCRSDLMKQVFPRLDLASAMAISAAAASPNMGRATNPALVAVMALLNIRLGYWVPNPGVVQTKLAKQGQRVRAEGYSFDQVLATELEEVESRWAQLGGPGRRVADGLVGISFSGGGIRSATLNLGIVQALHRAGVFRHADYMSTVSGGGYLGSSISALMRTGPAPVDGDSQTPDVDGSGVEEGDEDGPDLGSAGQIFRWRVRPRALVDEILGRLDEKRQWVNVSDGGHIENLAAIELLRRRCRYVIVGDGEADPKHHFNGLATLIRTARIDLGVEVKIKADALRLNDGTGTCERHWAIGKIVYPEARALPSYLLYLKSSLTDDEDEVIRQYRNHSPSFPHESTADQAFSEGQFEAYRSLGQHIGEDVLEHASPDDAQPRDMSFADLQGWFETLAKAYPED